MSAQVWDPPLDSTPDMRAAREEIIWALAENSSPRLNPENLDIIEACARLQAEFQADSRSFASWRRRALFSFLNFLGMAGAGSRQRRWRKPVKLVAKVNKESR